MITSWMAWFKWLDWPNDICGRNDVQGKIFETLELGGQGTTYSYMLTWLKTFFLFAQNPNAIKMTAINKHKNLSHLRIYEYV